jgi:hypothetical protein
MQERNNDSMNDDFGFNLVQCSFFRNGAGTIAKKPLNRTVKLIKNVDIEIGLFV